MCLEDIHGDGSYDRVGLNKKHMVEWVNFNRTPPSAINSFEMEWGEFITPSFLTINLLTTKQLTYKKNKIKMSQIIWSILFDSELVYCPLIKSKIKYRKL